MKLSFLFMVIPLFAISQKNNCDSGWSFMPTIGTTGLIIKVDTCLPDSICKKLWRKFEENLCGEMSFGYFEIDTSGICNNCLSYDRQNTWNDSTGCSTKEVWKKTIKGEWVVITKIEYDRIMKERDCVSQTDTTYLYNLHQ